MNCPVCNNAMIILELQQVEVDYCSACGGVWLDAGELEQLFEDAKTARQTINSFDRVDHAGERSYPCPICMKKMEKVVNQSHLPVIIDRCPKGHGLWFDKGELQQVLSQTGSTKEQKIVKLLSEIFNYSKGKVENGY